MTSLTQATAPARIPTRGERWLLVAITLVALVVSGVIAKDRLTWLLETIWAALIYDADADAFLATQWDMFLCLCGALGSLLVLSRWHDRQLGPVILADK